MYSFGTFDADRTVVVLLQTLYILTARSLILSSLHILRTVGKLLSANLTLGHMSTIR
jgi:hypothetical protein